MGSFRRTVNELRVTSNGFMECLDAVERASGWKERRGKLGYGRGLGVAGSCYISGTNYPIYPNRMPQSAVQLQVDRSGRVAVFSGASDIGQGSTSLVAYIVCEELGVPLDYVRVLPSDTDFTPGRPRRLLVARHLHAGQRLRGRGAQAQGAWCRTPWARSGRSRANRVLLAGGRAMDGQDTGRTMSDRGGVQPGRGEARHAGRRRQLQHAARRARRVPRRDDRRVAGVLVHGARGRGGGRRRRRGSWR